MSYLIKTISKQTEAKTRNPSKMLSLECSGIVRSDKGDRFLMTPV